mmetsp:Transcript_4806/g.8921  ORF Transcript_4806/g.8921 Transcript_4806/m.8921 type:complete len:420 (+) Transcript_4806:393-1652(+)
MIKNGSTAHGFQMSRLSHIDGLRFDVFFSVVSLAVPFGGVLTFALFRRPSTVGVVSPFSGPFVFDNATVGYVMFQGVGVIFWRWRWRLFDVFEFVIVLRRRWRIELVNDFGAGRIGIFFPFRFLDGSRIHDSASHSVLVFLGGLEGCTIGIGIGVIAVVISVIRWRRTGQGCRRWHDGIVWLFVFGDQMSNASSFDVFHDFGFTGFGFGIVVFLGAGEETPSTTTATQEQNQERQESPQVSTGGRRRGGRDNRRGGRRRRDDGRRGRSTKGNHALVGSQTRLLQELLFGGNVGGVVGVVSVANVDSANGDVCVASFAAIDGPAADSTFAAELVPAGHDFQGQGLEIAETLRVGSQVLHKGQVLRLIDAGVGVGVVSCQGAVTIVEIDDAVLIDLRPTDEIGRFIGQRLQGTTAWLLQLC